MLCLMRTQLGELSSSRLGSVGTGRTAIAVNAPSRHERAMANDDSCKFSLDLHAAARDENTVESEPIAVFGGRCGCGIGCGFLRGGVRDGFRRRAYTGVRGGGGHAGQAGDGHIVGRRSLPVQQANHGALAVGRAQLQCLTRPQRNVNGFDVNTAVCNLNDGVDRVVSLPVGQGVIDAREGFPFAYQIEAVSRGLR